MRYITGRVLHRDTLLRCYTEILYWEDVTLRYFTEIILCEILYGDVTLGYFTEIFQ